MMYCYGRGVDKDYAQAAQWWRKAAEQGNATVQRGLGALYALGQGLERDYGQAAT